MDPSFKFEEGGDWQPKEAWSFKSMHQSFLDFYFPSQSVFPLADQLELIDERDAQTPNRRRSTSVE